MFADLLEGYDFWGHADLDVLHGDLRSYLTEELLARFDRVFMCGHLSLYRNTAQSNQRFRLAAPGIDFESILRDPRYFGFDEWRGMAQIHSHHELPYFHDMLLFADPSPLRADIRVDDGCSVDASDQVFAWDNGVIKQFYGDQGRSPSPRFHVHPSSEASHDP